MIGQRFNLLTVLAVNGPFWKCRCDCGTERVFLAKSVKSGNTRSCGCLKRRERSRRSLELTPVGTVFGRLTVVENRIGTCLVSCACGAQKEIQTNQLRSGKVSSCGCLRAEQLAARTEKPLPTGSVFGRLTVIDYGKKKSKCACACGVITIVQNTKLRTGHTLSCGCWQREQVRAQMVVIPPGTVFGDLTVIEQRSGQGEGSSCLCRCVCGRERLVSAKKLRNGQTKSCGCRRQELARELSKANQLDSGVAAFRSVYASYRKNAELRGLPFELSREMFRKIASENCAYCGQTPNLQKSTGGGAYAYIGIDRVDNALGYTESNSVACCAFCNRAKSSSSLTDFKAWLASVGTARGPANSNVDNYRVRKKFYLYKHRSKNGFQLTLDAFAALVSSPCRYCGAPPDPFHGVDRRDNRLGYTTDNSVPCCARCNRAKSDASELLFRTWLDRVVSFNRKE